MLSAFCYGYTHLFIYLFIIYLFIYFFYLFIHVFIYLFIRLFIIYSFIIYLFIYLSFIYLLFIYLLFIYLVFYLFIYLQAGLILFERFLRYFALRLLQNLAPPPPPPFSNLRHTVRFRAIPHWLYAILFGFARFPIDCTPYCSV